MSASGPTKMSNPGRRYRAKRSNGVSETLSPTTLSARPRAAARARPERPRTRSSRRTRRRRTAAVRTPCAAARKCAYCALLVELEVRRADDDDRVGADLGRVRGERDGVGRRLRPAVDGDLEPVRRPPAGRDRPRAPLLDASRIPSPAVPSARIPSSPARDVEVGERPERGLVDLAARVRERRHRSRESAAERGISAAACLRARARPYRRSGARASRAASPPRPSPRTPAGA